MTIRRNHPGAPDGSGATNRVGAWFAALTSAVAFALHYVWENVQCSAFFVHASPRATPVDMVQATLGDVAMTWIAYAAVAVAVGRWDWPAGRWGWRH